MATVRSSNRLLRLLQLLVFCFAVVSWSSSLFLNLPLPSSLTDNHKQYNKHKPSSLELVNAHNSSQYVSRSLDDSILERRHIDPSFERTWTELSFIQRLQLDHTQGHNTTSLSQLSSNVNTTATSTITALIHATDHKSLRIQLGALLDQTMAINTTWIVCSNDLRVVAEIYAAKYPSLEVTVLVIDIDSTTYPERSAGATPWLYLLPRVHTDYVWILEDGVKPSSNYLKTTFALLQTDEYKDTLLGSHASLLPPSKDATDTTTNRLQLHCLPSAFHLLPKLTRPVDMIHHTWLLRVEWIPLLLTERRLDALKSPLPYYISQSLLVHASIPSVVIPPAIISSTNDADTSSPLLYLQNIKPSVSCITAIPSAYQQSKYWSRLLAMNSSPTVLDYRYFSQPAQPSKALFFIDGPKEANAFLPLVCQFDASSSSNGLSTHVVVTGKQRGLSGSSVSALIHGMPGCNPSIKVHDLDHFTLLNPMDTANHISLQLSRWIQALQPRIIFHSRHDSPLFHSVATLVQSYHLPVIQLPIDDVQHALWIAKLPMEALQCWNQIKIDLVVITDRRPHSLSRLFNSIGHGVYLGDHVDLTIHMEQTSDRVTRMFVNSFSWSQGTKRLRHRIRKGGLMPAIVESWYPSSNDNYGVILEDDIEVSPLFYTWIKYNILHYRYSKRDTGYDRIYGISLYSPRNLELLPEGRIEFDPNDVLLPNDFAPRTPYASQVPCSWGAVYFPEHWREFHHYLTTRLMDLRHSKRLKIHVPNSRSERWKKSWKKYFIEMVYLRAYVMVYPNFQDFESFSTNHLEFGTHIKHERAQVALDSFVVPLMQRNTILSQLPDHRLPRFYELPMMDLWGDLMTHDEMETVAATWHQAVSVCARWPSNHFNPQDMLCPFDTVDGVDSLDVATMTTPDIDYEHFDDQVKDLESNWDRILSNQATQQLA